MNERATADTGTSESRTRRSVRGLSFALPLAAGAATLLQAGTASAQEWLKDRMYAEGAGVRTGDVEWHPGIAAEGGYDSNYFYRTDKTGPNLINGAPIAPIQGTPEMRITPSLSLSTLGAQRMEGGGANQEPPAIKFRLNASGTYREFFGVLQPEQRNMDANANARLDIYPERTFGGALFAGYQRVIQPNVIGNPDLAYNRDSVLVGAEVSTQPGGGTLDGHIGYQFQDTLFEDTAGQPYTNFINQVYIRERWKFRPRTALIYDGSAGFTNYQNQTAANIAGAIGQLYNSTPVRTRIGINGLVTPRFSFLGMVGYGGSFLTPGSATGKPPSQYDSVIGQAEFKFYITAQPGLESGPPSLTLSSLSVGYNRDFTASYLSNWYGSDRGYLKFSYFFAGRALVSLEGGAGAAEYPSFQYVTYNKIQPGFTDIKVDATLFGEYRFTNYFAVNLTAKYTTEQSSTILQIAQAPVTNYAMEWQRLELYGGLRLFL